MERQQGGAVRQTFALLMSGLNYRAYREGFLARMDEQLVRQRAANLIIETRNVLNKHLQVWQAANITPATREESYPNAQTMKDLRTLRSAVDLLEQLQITLLTMPVPADDNIWLQYHSQASVLEALKQSDIELLIAAADLREAGSNLQISQLLDGPEDRSLYHRQLAQVTAIIATRSRILFPKPY